MAAELSETAQRVIETIASELGLPADRVILASSFQRDLKADSLAVAQLILALEETFDIMVPDKEAEKMTTVDDAVRFVEAEIASD